MIKSFVFLMATLLCTLFCFSQENKVRDEYRNEGFFNITRFSIISIYDYETETFNKTNGNVVSDLPTNNSKAYSLQTINGYFINPFLSVGIGIGLDGYHNPSVNTLPIFFDGRLYLRDKPSSMYFLTNIGGMVKINNGTRNGSMLNLGIGIKFPINKKRLFLVSDASYSYKSISMDGQSVSKSDNLIRVKGIMISLGLIF